MQVENEGSLPVVVEGEIVEREPPVIDVRRVVPPAPSRAAVVVSSGLALLSSLARLGLHFLEGRERMVPPSERATDASVEVPPQPGVVRGGLRMGPAGRRGGPRRKRLRRRGR